MPIFEKVMDSRRTFVETLRGLSSDDDRIVVVISDVGFSYLSDPHLPFRIVNVGAAEQHAAVFATALALSGWRVFVYSMINFVLFRCGEQVRNGAVFHHVPVTFLGVKGGPSYKFLGTGHNLLHDREDFNFCDNIGLAWRNPKTNEEVRNAVLDAYRSSSATYIRL